MRRLLVPAGILFYSVVAVSSGGAEVGSLSVFMTSQGFAGAKLQRRFPNHLFVPVVINNHRTGLMVDTGAPFTLIDRNSVNTLGLKVEKTNAQVGGVFGVGAERYGSSKLNAITMGNCTLLNVPVAVSDQSDINYFGGLSHLAGLFGAHEMHKFGVVIDCARQTLYINPRGANSGASQQLASFLAGRGFIRVPLRVNSHSHFEIDGAVNGHPAGFIVDTGSGTTLLTKLTAINYGVSPAPLRLQAEAPDGQVEYLNSGVVKMLSIGGFEIPNAEVTLGDVYKGVLSGGNDIGLLGEEYLTWNFGVIDIGGMSLYLRHADKR
jgi:predicted aspartyl protease